MTDEELIARLRKADEYEPLGHDGWEAADRIEVLVKREEKLGVLLSAAGSVADIQKQRAERLEAALRGIVDHDLFHDDQYLSASLVAKLEAARAALKGADHE